MLEKDIKKVLVTEEQIKQRCDEIGRELAERFRDNDRKVILVGILKGSVPFMAELIKHIDLPIEVDFMCVSSYQGTKSLGDIKIIKDLDRSVEGQDIVLVEDIVDTGITIKELKRMMVNKAARSVTVVTMLDKPSRREVDVKADYIGFEVENEFVVGYGLDYDQVYRNLPYVGVLKDELYK